MNENFNLKNLVTVVAAVLLIAGGIYYFSSFKGNCCVEDLPTTDELVCDSIRVDSTPLEADTLVE
jgi:predicted metal-binding membrane protein